jgi:menaquinone-9 beta-reductase
LFRRSGCDAAVGDIITRLRGQSGSLLSARLEHARFDRGSLCSVGGLSFRDEAIDERECRVGDALTMIPPVTGNGMSMAFESALCALGPLHRYARGEQDWLEATKEIAGVLSRRFGRRLFCARFLHDIMFSRAGQMGLWLRAPPLWRTAFLLTR